VDGTAVQSAPRDLLRRLPALVVYAVLILAALWVLFLAEGTPPSLR
jgi:hypothetical protein